MAQAAKTTTRRLECCSWGLRCLHGGDIKPTVLAVALTRARCLTANSPAAPHSAR